MQGIQTLQAICVSDIQIESDYIVINIPALLRQSRPANSKVVITETVYS